MDLLPRYPPGREGESERSSVRSSERLGVAEPNLGSEHSLCVQVNRMYVSTRSVLNIRALVNKIFSFLDYLSLSRSACVSLALSRWTQEERLWSTLLRKQYGQLLSSCETAPRQLYSKCFAADQAIYSITPLVYEYSRVLYEGEHTPLTIAFDHRYFMSGHIDSTIKVWGQPSLQENRRQTIAGNRMLLPDRELRGHTSWVKCLQFDAECIVSGSYDSQLREWDIGTGRCLSIFKGHGTGVQHSSGGSPRGSVVCLHANSQFVLSGSNDQTVRLWRRVQNRGEILQMYRESNEEKSGGAGPPSIQVAEPLLVLEGHRQTVRCLEFKGTVACTGGSDRVIRVWDLTTGAERAALGGNRTPGAAHTHRVSCLQMSECKNLIVSGSNDRTVRLWDLRQPNQHIGVVKEQGRAIRRLQFDPDMRKLITGGDEAMIQAFDFRRWHSDPNRCRLLCKFAPSHAVERTTSRVSAMQYNAHQLACAFTLGHTDPSTGNHHRYGSIKIWDMESMDGIRMEVL